MSWEMTAEYKVICVFLDRKVCVVKKIFVSCKKDICVCRQERGCSVWRKDKMLIENFVYAKIVLEVQRNWSSDMVDLSGVMHIVLKFRFLCYSD